MTDSPQPRLLANIAPDRIEWFMLSAERLLARGVVATYEELRGVQVRAGVLSVVLYRFGGGFHLPERLTYRGEWPVGHEETQAELDRLTTQAAA